MSHSEMPRLREMGREGRNMVDGDRHTFSGQHTLDASLLLLTLIHMSHVASERQKAGCVGCF